MGSSGPNNFELENLVENGRTPTEEKAFPYNGDPFEDLDDKAKKIFEACKNLTFQTFEGLDEKAKKLLQTCQYLNQQTSEGLDEKAKKLLQACQDPDHNSIQDLDEDTLKKEDKNGMKIFHVLLFDQQNKELTEWYTKSLDDTASRKKVVAIIEAICQKFPKLVEPMMIHPDNFGRTPLHYAGIIDVGEENEDTNITLTLLKYGADEALFMEDRKQETPVSFIETSNLKAHLDTKQRIEGPVGHKDRVAHCDISILQPKVEDNQKTKSPLKLDYLQILAKKHRDLFDHQVISAMIWEKRKEYLPAIFFASFMKLLTLLLVLVAFGLRFGPRQEKEKSSRLFYISFGIEFTPIFFNIYVAWSIKNFVGCFFRYFYHSKRTFLLSMFHLGVGISLIVAFERPLQVTLSNQKGLAGLYCICSAYCLFRTSKDLLQPTVFEMFGWFEVVFKNIIKLLAVHSWLLLTFVFAFYIQFSNFEENTDQEVWTQVCKTKFSNCTEIITKLNTRTELKAEIFDDCIDFFKNCTQPEADDENPFNDWKVIFKALSMSAGELGFDDLQFDDNPIYVLTFVLFTIVVLFVIMNLMTSLAVSDIHDIRNESRDGTWYKLMFTLIWYNAALPVYIQELIIGKQNEDKDVNIISFKLNDIPHLTKPETWSNFFTRMPDSVSIKAKGNAQMGTISKDIFSIVHNMDNFEDIIIIFGTSTKFYEVPLKKGQAYERPVGYWKTKFAIVDYKDGFDKRRKMYRTQCFTVSGSTKLEIKFRPYDGADNNGQFVVFDQSDKNIEGTIKQYVDAKPTEEVENAINKYKTT